MDFLHAMLRVGDLDRALVFFRDGLGLELVRKVDNPAGRYTLAFLAAPADVARHRAAGPPDAPGLPVGLPMVELTWNWDESACDGGRNFGHLAYRVDDIYAICAHLSGMGVAIARPPRDGRMAFVRSPDGISIELLQRGDPLPPAEPWASAPNIGIW